SMILPPRGKRCQKFHVDKRTYSCSSSHESNSLIQFYQPGTDPKQNQTSTGGITAILQIPLDNMLRTFVIVQKHRPLPIQFYADHPELVVDSQPEPDAMVIEPRHVIAHLTAWERPANMYNTKRSVFRVCWALNRGRR
ncbi:hypothetical protein B0H11DRAFT_1665609, partial [Mycena galericulata]